MASQVAAPNGRRRAGRGRAAIRRSRSTTRSWSSAAARAAAPTMVVAVHSTALGPALGGAAHVALRDRPTTASRDALRLAARDDLKAAAAGLDLGGGKGVICAPGRRPATASPTRRGDAARLRRPGRVARRPLHHRRGRRHGARRHGRDRRAHRARHRAAAERGGSGDPSPFTAIGVEAAMRACVARALRHARTCAGLAGRRRRARPRRRAASRGGSRPTAPSWSSPTSTRPSARSPTALGARWVEPGRGDARRVRRARALRARRRDRRAATSSALRCEIVCGAANNQLADEALAERARRARDPLRARLHRQRRRPDQRLPRDPRATTPSEARELRRGIEATMRAGARAPPHERGVDAAGRGARARPRAARGAGAVAARARLSAMARALGRPRRASSPTRRRARCRSALEAARQAGEIPDVLLLLEHPPVYTKGRRTTPDELPMGEDWYRMQGIEVTETDRGGRVTYHGPGQLVAYPIVALREPYGDDVHDYMRRMERVMIAALADYGVEAGLIEGLTGVWVGDRRRRRRAQDRLDRHPRQPRRSPPTASRSTSTTTCSRSSGSCPAGSRPAG